MKKKKQKSAIVKANKILLTTKSEVLLLSNLASRMYASIQNRDRKTGKTIRFEIENFKISNKNM
jgi:hypothetical protein